MSGIAGIFGRPDESALRTMTQMLRHRGPDGGAIWLSASAALGHRSLNVSKRLPVELQPVLSDDGHHSLVLDGSLLNRTSLSADLRHQGYTFDTGSDAQVLLAACMKWGNGVVDHLAGHYAFAYVDTRSNIRFLVRDHLGVKPLYYTEHEDRLYFASEPKALLAVLPQAREVAWNNVPGYLAFLWVPGENGLLKRVHKLEPGCMLVEENGKRRTIRYWNALDRWLGMEQNTDEETDRDQRLRSLLADTVATQSGHDTAAGLLLSGGLDSTIILSVMAEKFPHPSAVTATYSAQSRSRDVFEDDLPYARQAAAHFGAELKEMVITADVADILPDIIWQLDEALADPTTVTNFLLTRQVKDEHSVLLNGMGADELFAGYPRHPAVMLGNRLRYVPSVLLRSTSGILRFFVDHGIVSLERARRPVQFFDHLHKPFIERCLGYSSYWSAEELQAVLAGSADQRLAVDDVFSSHRRILDNSKALSPLSRLLLLELLTVLPKLNQENLDKTGMAHGVEVRVPYLDHRLVEYSMSLPDTDKLFRNRRKVILRRAYSGIIAEEILNRPKTGYSPPVRAWMRDNLRDVTEDTLFSPMANSRGLFASSELRRIMDENFAGKRDHSLKLWALLTLELWLRELQRGERWVPPVRPDTLSVIHEETRGTRYE